MTTVVSVEVLIIVPVINAVMVAVAAGIDKT